jgi:hypothetical protein
VQSSAERLVKIERETDPTTQCRPVCRWHRARKIWYASMGLNGEIFSFSDIEPQEHRDD